MAEPISGRVEAEIAVGFRSDILGADPGESDLLQASSWVAPALEIVDSRIANWSIKISDTIGNDASSAYFCLARQMMKRGNPLRAGKAILSGALGAMVPVSNDSSFGADIDHRGSVSIRF